MVCEGYVKRTTLTQILICIFNHHYVCGTERDRGKVLD